MNKIKNEIFRITGIMLLFLVLLVSVAQSQTNITSCTTISAPGEYVQTQDIINGSPADNICINIVSSGVIFNGAGHIIDGVSNNLFMAAIYASPTTTNITIENTTDVRWDFGIVVEQAHAVKIVGNNVGGLATLAYI